MAWWGVSCKKLPVSLGPRFVISTAFPLFQTVPQVRLGVCFQRISHGKSSGVATGCDSGEWATVASDNSTGVHDKIMIMGKLHDDLGLKNG